MGLSLDTLRAFNTLIPIKRVMGILCILFMTAMLTACNEDSLEDLEQYINQARMKKGTVKPLPKFEPVQSFAYAAKDMRNPFRNWQINPVDKLSDKRKRSGPQPNIERPKERLEQFPLDALVLRGTLKIGAVRWALIRSPDNVIYRVRNGNHLGKNFGKVIRVAEDRVHLTEIMPNGLGGWEKRQSTLSTQDATK